MSTKYRIPGKSPVPGISMIIAGFLALTVLSTCGNENPTKPEPPVQQIPTSLAITPTPATLTSIGQKVQLTAVVRDQNGRRMSDASISWSSSDVNLATVDAQGLVVAVGNGTARITGRSGNAGADVRVTVSQLAASIMIEPDTATLRSIGETVQLICFDLCQPSSGRGDTDVIFAWFVARDQKGRYGDG